MRTFILLLTFAFPSLIYAGDIQGNAEVIIEKSGLSISKKLNPIYLADDFNGDGKIDLVFYVVSKSNSKSGLCIVHSTTSECIVLGAGNKFHAGGDDFRWVDLWNVIPPGETWETTFKPDGDVLGTKKVILKNKSIELCVDESGCGVITYRNGAYVWVHHAD